MTVYGVPTVAWVAGAATVFAAGLCAVGYATATDASARGVEGPLWQGLVCGLFLPSAVGYWWRRGDGAPRSRPPTARELAARAVALAVVAGFVLGAVFGPPDVVLQSVALVAGTAAALPVALLVVTRRP